MKFLKRQTKEIGMGSFKTPQLYLGMGFQEFHRSIVRSVIIDDETIHPGLIMTEEEPQHVYFIPA
jgi:hypothetical protein